MNTPWGKWELSDDKRCLVCIDNGCEIYYIDLMEIRSSAILLDYIFQLKSKSWMTPRCMFDLLTAIETVIAPQANLCSWGKDKPYSYQIGPIQ